MIGHRLRGLPYQQSQGCCGGAGVGVSDTKSVRARVFTHDHSRKATSPASAPLRAMAMEKASWVEPGPGKA
jgi:hypothetical protein